ncbi:MULTISPECIES: group II truncated hemoglobin [unclassified Pusillimonas]|uniref:group II truncated hemoglobin n=1 Tax=unclassified Pusillimonas TaxID=2640016 RepID=UPI000B9CD1F0|nr:MULTISPECIES: group II truncated hemoglobin [unclassified Pusillimonas]OXR49579.1 globin [Pusillimonas sp. T2]ROT44365.1 globin [Pusillimonas sp. NJUB218]
MSSDTAPTQISPYDQLGGEDKVKELVERFYDLMELDPAYLALRAAHGPELAQARERLFWFLCGWLGGPAYYMEKVGHPMLRARHLPFSIGIIERDQWVACMAQAMKDVGIPETLSESLKNAFMSTADWMRNRPE